MPTPLPEPLTQDGLRRWLCAVIGETRLNSTALARAAGLAPSTLNRFLNNPVDWQLSSRTIGRIQAVAAARAKAEAA